MQYSQENTYAGTALLKIDSDIGAFLRILQNFSKQLFL